jgi:hypothetical protein
MASYDIIWFRDPQVTQVSTSENRNQVLFLSEIQIEVCRMVPSTKGGSRG